MIQTKKASTKSLMICVAALVATPLLGWQDLGTSRWDVSICKTTLVALQTASVRYAEKHGDLPQKTRYADALRTLLQSEVGRRFPELQHLEYSRERTPDDRRSRRAEGCTYVYVHETSLKSDDILAYCRHSHSDGSRLAIDPSGNSLVLTTKELVGRLQSQGALRDPNAPPPMSPDVKTMCVVATVLGALMFLVARMIFRS
ncbi:MAG: hypothetical protein AAF517_28740, partial [Planctomycetota bacterium]